jgi:hypothetical protein
LKILPRAANAFDVELYEFRGAAIGDVCVGILECHSDGREFHILHRERDFEPLIITHGYTLEEQNRNRFDAHNLTIEIRKSKQGGKIDVRSNV